MPRGPGPRGPYRTGIRRRREIIEAASRVFAEYGFVGGSMRQIATDVGVTSAALNRHFASKEDLLEAVTRLWDDEVGHLLPSYDGLDGFLCLPALLKHHLAHPGLSELYLMLAAEASRPDHPARSFIFERYRRVVSHGAESISQAIALGQVQPMEPKRRLSESRGVFALMDGIQLQWLVDKSIDLVGDFSTSLGTILSKWSGIEVQWNLETEAWDLETPLPGVQLSGKLPSLG